MFKSIMKESFNKTIANIKKFASSSIPKVGAVAIAGYLTVSSAFADIVTYDAATGNLTWDLSTVISGLVAVLAICAGGCFIMFTIIAGISFAKKMLKG